MSQSTRGPIFQGLPSPSVRKMKRMSAHGLEQHIQRLEAHRQCIEQRIERLQARANGDPRPIRRRIRLLERLTALQREARRLQARHA